MELPTATVGSLSYAEDENRHFLGLKAAIVRKDGQSQFVCYILECDSEVSLQKNLVVSCSMEFRLLCRPTFGASVRESTKYLRFSLLINVPRSQTKWWDRACFVDSPLLLA